MKKWLKLLFFVYLFILAIELIKKTSAFLAPDITNFLLQNPHPIEAISIGWFTTALVQSSGAVGSIAAAFAGNEIISLQTAVYILLGASLGTTITALLISVITLSKRRRDFRHGFEIGLCYAIYSALLVFIVFFMEYFFKLFSNTSFFLASKVSETAFLTKVPNIIDIITFPIIGIFLGKVNNLLLLVFAFFILIFALKFISTSVVDVFGGEEKTRKFINRHFNSKFKAYFLGAFITAIIFSSSISISFLVPLAVSRLISLRQTIPFILGADLGTVTDVLVASIVLGQVNAFATFIAFLMFGIIGALIFLPNIEFLFKITKYTSKKLINISRRKALYFLLAFILIPLILILVF